MRISHQEGGDDRSETEAEENVAEVENAETLRQVLAEERAKAQDYLDNCKRAQADFINFKRRNEREREETKKLANSALILNLLPILDDLERAFASVPHRPDKHGWVDGIRLIERKFRNILEAQGLTQIKAQGEAFDPNLHEAAMHVKGKEGIVVKELQKGYKLNDKLLRPAKVAVGNGQEEDEPAEDFWD